MLPVAESSGNFLVSPGLGLMLWTLALFLFTMWVLNKTAFPRIQEALEKRANAIRDNIEASEKQRAEADELLADYRKRLAEARAGRRHRHPGPQGLGGCDRRRNRCR
jgi:F-type H+-transporting ATPase subunit b